jgi:pyruvate/2-oxoglutarate dehydrogenase complex dihydrolipoamide acyltransferase (E2) component
MYQDRTYEEIPLNGMRKIIAARLTEAKQPFRISTCAARSIWIA